MMAAGILNLILIPIILVLPTVILYFTIKLAIKNAIKELKDNGDI